MKKVCLLFKIVRGGASDSPYGIDGLSGKPLTSNGVQHMFDFFWLGDKGFGPFPKKVREGRSMADTKEIKRVFTRAVVR